MPISIPKARNKIKNKKIRATKSLPVKIVKGMKDMSPEKMLKVDTFFDILKKSSTIYGFKHIEPALIEDNKLYCSVLKNGCENNLYKTFLKTSSFRNSYTFGIIRMYLENKLSRLYNPGKFWYFGWILDKSKNNNFNQILKSGFEIINGYDYIFDAQLILTAFNTLKNFGFKKIIVNLNSLGCSSCRKVFSRNVNKYCKKYASGECLKCAEKYKNNALEIISCIENKCGEDIKSSVPLLIDNLCNSCKTHFKSLIEVLDALQIPYSIDPFLINSNSVLNRTIFNIKIENSNNVLGYGFRSDYLIKNLGGSNLAHLNFEFNTEFILNNIKVNNKNKKVFVVYIGDDAKKKALYIMNMLNENNIITECVFLKRSLENQLEKAKRDGIKLLLMLGKKEAYEDVVIVRNIKTGAQETIPTDKILKKIKKELSNINKN